MIRARYKIVIVAALMCDREKERETGARERRARDRGEREQEER